MSTVYSNSIEIEWKPGSLSEEYSYQVKYRLYKNKLENLDGEMVSNDYNDQSSSEEDYSSSVPQFNDYYDTEENDINFITVNTNNTRLKVGNSSYPLKPYTFYEFKVVAASGASESKETNTLVVRTAATSKFKPIFCQID